MRQASLFETPIFPRAEQPAGLAGLMPSIRAAMNRVAGKDEECRKQLVETINIVAKRECVALTRGGGKSIEKTTLDKWLQPSDSGHAPSLEAIIIFCLATSDISPILPVLQSLGLVAVSKEELRYLEYGRACASMKTARLQLKKAESLI